MPGSDKCDNVKPDLLYKAHSKPPEPPQPYPQPPWGMTNNQVLAPQRQKNPDVSGSLERRKLSSKVRHRAFEPELAVTKVHAIDYSHNTSNKPKQNERDQILAHLKELGEPEVTDARINTWFHNSRQKERKRPSLPLSTSALESKEKIWVDARHKSRKLLIPSSIISFPFLIRMLADDRWRFSLAVTQEENLERPRGSLCRTRCPRRCHRPSVRPLGGRSRCQTCARAHVVQVQSTRIRSSVAAGRCSHRRNLIPDEGGAFATPDPWDFHLSRASSYIATSPSQHNQR